MVVANSCWCIQSVSGWPFAAGSPLVGCFPHTDHYATCDDLNIVTDVWIFSQSRHKITHKQPLQEAPTAQLCITFDPRPEEKQWICAEIRISFWCLKIWLLLCCCSASAAALLLFLTFIPEHYADVTAIWADSIHLTNLFGIDLAFCFSRKTLPWKRVVESQLANSSSHSWGLSPKKPASTREQTSI